jgi:hypothetical protein
MPVRLYRNEKTRSGRWMPTSKDFFIRKQISFSETKPNLNTGFCKMKKDWTVADFINPKMKEKQPTYTVAEFVYSKVFEATEFDLYATVEG